MGQRIASLDAPCTLGNLQVQVEAVEAVRRHELGDAGGEGGVDTLVRSPCVAGHHRVGRAADGEEHRAPLRHESFGVQGPISRRGAS